MLSLLILLHAAIPKSDQHLQSKADWTVFCGEVVVGIKLTPGAVSLIKLLYKTATQGLDDDELDEGPSSLFNAFGIGFDMLGCLMAIPEQNDMPGAAYRNALRTLPRRR